MKKDKVKPVEVDPKKVSIKFVRKAGMWCKTTWKDKKQHIEWSVDKPAS